MNDKPQDKPQDAIETDLLARHCRDIAEEEGPMPDEDAQRLLGHLDDWSIVAEGQKLQRTFSFKNFYRTMSFVNALAHVVNGENHHPDLEVSYDKCTVTFWTHTVGGLSENDFICAAKVGALV